jgi:hypothetical protein
MPFTRRFSEQPLVGLFRAVRKCVVYAGCVTGALSAPLQAQVATEGIAPEPIFGPRVFLDCQGPLPCDRNHFRTEIRFVNWAQDRNDSDVHVLATSQMVGGGGRQITLDFIGRGTMAHLSDRMTYTSAGTDVMTETLNGLTQILRLGLMRYAVESGLARNFDIRFTGDLAPPTGRGGPAVGVASASARDPWNFWTFRVGLSGNMNLRETSQNVRANPSVSADRVTEAWKVGLSTDLNVQRNSRTLSSGREIRDDRNDWDLSGLIVRSVSGHFSTGMNFSGGNSVSGNRDARVEVSPALEYNYFPYAQANRRQLIVQAAAGVEYSNYIEETIFNVTQETRSLHSFRIRYNAREQWGNAGVGINLSQYLHDTSLYRASLNGNMNLRITRGLDLNLNTNNSLVRDEIHIPRSTISDEDILLGRMNLPSSYQYNGSVGVSYRWGSSFTNVVNTRFSAGGRGWN